MAMKKRAIRKTVGGLIKGRMAENKLSPADFEKAVGKSARTIERRIADPDSMTLGELRSLAVALEITVDEMKPYLW